MTGVGNEIGPNMSLTYLIVKTCQSADFDHMYMYSVVMTTFP